MATDPRQLLPGELCRLLNSTPLGEVIGIQQLLQHRMRAGWRIGDKKHIDLLRYVAWLVLERHGSKEAEQPGTFVDLVEFAEGVIAAANPADQMLLTAKQEALIAALLTEPTYTAAATKAGVSRTTLRRWLHTPAFREAYQHARRDSVDSSLGRLQTATSQAVTTLTTIARQGRRDSDRLRAAMAILDHATKTLKNTHLLQGLPSATQDHPMSSSDIVGMLSERLQELDHSKLPTSEKSRLTATLADALLRAIGVDVIDKRLEALQAVLQTRKDRS